MFTTSFLQGLDFKYTYVRFWYAHCNIWGVMVHLCYGVLGHLHGYFVATRKNCCAITLAQGYWLVWQLDVGKKSMTELVPISGPRNNSLVLLKIKKDSLRRKCKHYVLKDRFLYYKVGSTSAGE